MSYRDERIHVTTTENADNRQAKPILNGGPERAFRIGPLAMADGTVTSSMPLGPWLSGPAGGPPGSVLGVLVDDVLGCALMRERRPGLWSVSSEISVDLCRPVPAGGGVLAAEGRLMYSDDSGGLASGSVVDDAGRLIAMCRQHGRWVSAQPDAPPAERPAPSESPGPSAPAVLTELLGVRPRAADGGARLTVAVTADLANPLGNLHGGITLWVSDLVAQAAFAAAGGPTRTTSVHVAYPRPMPLGTTVRFEGQVIHRGRTFGVARVTVLNAAGKPCAVATVTTSA
jgi:uncharacterized protein (TIGR00369 family)